jgi:hypothetical protein
VRGKETKGAVVKYVQLAALAKLLKTTPINWLENFDPAHGAQP